MVLTDEGVLVEFLQMRGGRGGPVDNLAVVHIRLREMSDRRVRPVAVFDGAWWPEGGKKKKKKGDDMDWK